jgi:hypothetical protein
MGRQPFVLAPARCSSWCGIIAGPVSAQGKWWTSERFIKLLGLSQDSRRVGRGVSSAIASRATKREMDRQEAPSPSCSSARCGGARVMVAIEQLESARGELGKLRALMLWMRRV